MPNATLVQATAHGTTSVTFGATPTQNNILVAFCFSSSGTAPTLNSGAGWAAFAPSLLGGSGPSSRVIAASWRVAGAGESAAQSPFTANATGTMVQEWNTGVSTSPVDTLNGGTSLTTFSTPLAGSTSTTISRTPTAGQDALILCFWCVKAVGAGPNFSAETLTGSLSMVEDDDWGDNSGSFMGAVAHLEVVSTTGAYAGTATSVDVANVQANAIVVLKTAAAGAVVIPPGLGPVVSMQQPLLTDMSLMR